MTHLSETVDKDKDSIVATEMCDDPLLRAKAR